MYLTYLVWGSVFFLPLERPALCHVFFWARKSCDEPQLSFFGLARLFSASAVFFQPLGWGGVSHAGRINQVETSERAAELFKSR